MKSERRRRFAKESKGKKLTQHRRRRSMQRLGASEFLHGNKLSGGKAFEQLGGKKRMHAKQVEEKGSIIIF